MTGSNLDPRRKKVVFAALGRQGDRSSLEYWQDTLPGLSELDYPKDWCGGFALWAIHQADLGKDLNWKIGSGFLIPNLSITSHPQPGDIAYFDHNQHHAIVTAVNGTSVSLVSGNGMGGQVTVSMVPMSAVTAFFSLDPLLRKAGPTSVSGACPGV